MTKEVRIFVRRKPLLLSQQPKCVIPTGDRAQERLVGIKAPGTSLLFFLPTPKPFLM